MWAVCSGAAQRLSLLAAGFLFLFVGLGCGDDSGVGKTYPVRGKVTLDGQPLVAESTVILFKPDSSRGNSSAFEPVSTVDEEGNYALLTKGKKGAPAGWYKVLVTALAEAPQHASGAKRHRPVARSLLPARYGQAQTTTLSIEVVADPAADAYDLKLTSR
jgi:hypothetical protein